MPLSERAALAGDPGAVLVAPQLQVHVEPRVLLSVFGPRGAPVDGIWTSLDDVAEDEVVVTMLRSVAEVVDGRVEPPARRPDWFRTSWYDEVEAWVDAELAALGRTRTGPCIPANVWSISAAIEIPCSPRPVWFKASCHHFHAEPALTRLVSEMVPEHAPSVVATDDVRAWALLEEIAGVDYLDADPAPAVGAAAARATAALQLRSLDHLAEIEAAGIPLRDLTMTGRQFDSVLGESVELAQLTAEELSAARACRDEVQALFGELGSLGIPTTLVHGDLHTGNLAQDGDALVLYDWSDAALSHPFLDVDLLGQRLSDEERASAVAAYAEAWRAAYPDADIDRALELAGRANRIYQMVTFEQIYEATEDASYWEMRGVVAGTLRDLPELFPHQG
jgi:aminoglycoside phosphotransferase (APT) family kinase protein